jgi:hypothetical protein
VLPDAFANAFTFRNLGPFRTGARVTDFAVPDTPGRDHQRVFYVATRNGPNPERGVFRTRDGGLHREKVLYVKDRVRAIDLVVVPGQPEVLYAATYEKERYPWTYVVGGEGSGIRTSSTPSGDAPGSMRVRGGWGEVYRSDDAGTHVAPDPPRQHRRGWQGAPFLQHPAHTPVGYRENAHRRKANPRIPAGHVGAPDDVAEAVAFLVSPPARLQPSRLAGHVRGGHTPANATARIGLKA